MQCNLSMMDMDSYQCLVQISLSHYHDLVDFSLTQPMIEGQHVIAISSAVLSSGGVLGCKYRVYTYMDTTLAPVHVSITTARFPCLKWISFPSSLIRDIIWFPFAQLPNYVDNDMCQRALSSIQEELSSQLILQEDRPGRENRIGVKGALLPSSHRPT